jgi:tetratricopeptide (TPR) repeat protein
MKSVSQFALAVAMASLSLTASAGVWAAEEKPKKEKKEKAKKEKAPAPLKLALSKEFTAVYNPVVAVYTKKRDAASAAVAKESWPTIKAAIMNDDDRYQAGNLAQDLARMLNNDSALRLDAIDLLITSARTPDTEKNIAYYVRGAMAFDARDWPTAVTNLQKSYDMGFRQNNVEGGTELLLADAFAQQGKLPEAIAWMAKSEQGSKVAGAKPLPGNFDAKLANFALKTKDYRYIGPAMQGLVRRNPTVDFWHDSLMQTYTYVELDSQEVLDLMRLLRTVGAMKYQQNYSAYATESIAAFFPTEVKGLLEEGFAKKTISDKNATFGPLYKEVQEKLNVDPFSVAQLDKDIAGAKTGFDAAVSGDIALSVGEYARAKGAYETALAKGGIVDPKDRKDLTERTTMRLGMAKMKLGDMAGARAEFAKVTSPGRRAIADFWVIYLDQLTKAAPAG